MPWREENPDLLQLRAQVLARLRTDTGSVVTVKAGRFLSYVPKTAYKDQVGPTCGLYALRNVMRYHYNALARAGVAPQDCLRRAPQLAARKLEQRGATNDSHLEDAGGLWVPEGMSLRELAKAEKLSGVGELLGGDRIVTLARKMGYDARCGQYLDRGYIAQIKSALARNVPPIVAFDVDHGGPTQALGAHGHWIMVVGYQSLASALRTTDVVYVMHWGQFYAFPLQELMTSAQQLQRFPEGSLAKQGRSWQWTPEPIDLHARATVPHDGNYVDRSLFGRRPVGLALTDVSRTLRGIIVEVRPRNAAVNGFAPEVRRVIAKYRGGLSRIFRRPSAQSLAAVNRLDALLGGGIGLTELLDAVLFYITPNASRNPYANLGDKLKPSSTLCSQLQEAIQRWRAAKA